jgi:hypothetical protein
MKSVFTFLLLVSCMTGFCNNKVFDKLAGVNKIWTEQSDARVPAASNAQSGTDWIKLHLSLVEQTLRARSLAHLSPAQQANRLRTLDHLNSYWQAGNFPINTDYSYQTPIFIDKYDNFCAVGYLMKATGHEAISRMIQAKTNLAYVREMRYTEVTDWAKEFGFTVDELAWIQPAYPPVHQAEGIGGGTDGEVIDLYPDNTNGKLYVAGRFTKVDSTITANNIAYLTEAGGVYTWHNMGSGTNGPVHAIAHFDNKVWIAGEFTEAGGHPANNVAYWDGSMWHGAGCTYGSVKDLVIFDNELYAVGNFDVCAALAEVNFAKWSAGNWQQIPGLEGHVNTAEMVANDLVLGGNFDYMGMPSVNIIRWNATSGFQPYTNTIHNEVMDIQLFHDTLYAACKQTSTADSMLLQKLDGGMWSGVDAFPTSTYYSMHQASYNTLFVHNDTLVLGGDFAYATQLVPGIITVNSINLFPREGTWINVDSAVNKTVLFNNRQISGGKFKYNYSWGTSLQLNSIAYKKTGPTSVPELPGASLLNVYPNPVASGSSLHIDNDFSASTFTLYDVNGRLVSRNAVKNGQNTVNLPTLAAGSYFAELSNNSGETKTKQLIIK